MPQEKYFLNWPSYSDHLRSTFRHMMETGDFSDVTLVCEDRKQFRAHRNILAAGSPMFMDLLQINQGTQPVIFLKGVQGSDLETILQFLYFGEATLYENRMTALLDVFKILGIQDLFKSINSDEILPTIVEKSDIVEEQIHSVDDFPPDSKMDLVKLDMDMDVEQFLQMKMNDQILPGNVEKTAQTKTNIVEEKLLSEDDFPPDSNIESIKLDMNVEQIPKPVYRCDQCDYQAKQRGHLKHHIRYTHQGIRFKCYICENQFSRKEILSQHIQSKHESIRYDCEECGKSFQFKNRLGVHMKSVHDGIRFPCDKCVKQFSTNEKLSIHIKAVHDGIRFHCDQCDKQFSRKDKLGRHIKSVHNGIRHSCNQCSYQSTRSDHLSMHIKEKH